MTSAVNKRALKTVNCVNRPEKLSTPNRAKRELVLAGIVAGLGRVEGIGGA